MHSKPQWVSGIPTTQPHSREFLVLVERVPSQAHDHRERLQFVVLDFSELAGGFDHRMHPCITKIYPGRCDRCHRLESLIGEVGCGTYQKPSATAAATEDDYDNTPVGHPKSFPPRPKPFWTTPDILMGYGGWGTSGPTTSGRDSRKLSVRVGAGGAPLVTVVVEVLADAITD